MSEEEIKEEEESEEEHYDDVSGEQLLNAIFQLAISATQKMAASGLTLDAAKKKTADFLELIVNGLKTEEDQHGPKVGS